MRPRIIPVLLLENDGLVKTCKFKDRVYVGDPINAIRLFNDMEVDELILLDIDAAKTKKGPNYDLLAELVSEAFMPLCYGGGIRKVGQVQKTFTIGIEKIAINSVSLEDSGELVGEVAKEFGSQSIVGALDVQKNFLGKRKIYDHVNQVTKNIDPQEYAQMLQAKGVGEILVNSVDQDGVMQGYDWDLIIAIAEVSSVPVIACGGASNLNDMKQAVELGVNAAAAGSLFVFKGRQRGVLINYPSQIELDKMFS